MHWSYPGAHKDQPIDKRIEYLQKDICVSRRRMEALEKRVEILEKVIDVLRAIGKTI